MSTFFSKSGASLPDPDGAIDTAVKGSGGSLVVPPLQKPRRRPTHNSVAKSERERKEAHPEAFCKSPRCLWRTSEEFCPRHRPLVMHTHDADGVALPAPLSTHDATRLGYRV
jgi:hypothetical protein